MTSVKPLRKARCLVTWKRIFSTNAPDEQDKKIKRIYSTNDPDEQHKKIKRIFSTHDPDEQDKKIKRQVASHFQPNLRAFQVSGSRGRFPKVLTESLSTNKDAIPKLNFTPLSAILLALIFMKCFSTLLWTISSKRANSPLPLQSNRVAVANGEDEGGGGKR